VTIGTCKDHAMTDASSAAPSLSPEELTELLKLMLGADTVELKLTVPEEYHRSAATALDIDPLDAQIRQVVFFDTKDLTLNAAGVVVRARRVQGEGDDSVVKLRPVVPNQLPSKLRKTSNFGVEVDAMPGGFVCSGSYKAALPQGQVRAVLRGEQPIHKLFSKEQRAFFAEHAPKGSNLDDLAILGPINVLKLKYTPEGYKRRLVAELWLYPDGSRILELSTKCLPADALDVAAETRAFLSKRGVDLAGEQQTKTRTALEYFSKLASAPA
jgi:hypothetical protein